MCVSIANNHASKLFYDNKNKFVAASMTDLHANTYLYNTDLILRHSCYHGDPLVACWLVSHPFMMLNTWEVLLLPPAEYLNVYAGLSAWCICLRKWPNVIDHHVLRSCILNVSVHKKSSCVRPYRTISWVWDYIVQQLHFNTFKREWWCKSAQACVYKRWDVASSSF